MKIKKLNESAKFKVNDKVFVKPNKKQGRVLKVKGDYITVEMDNGKDPVRIDTYYDTDLEAVDEITESKHISRVDDLYEGSIPRNASRIRATDRVSKKSMDLHKEGKYWREGGDEFSYKAYDPAYLKKWNDIEVLETDPNYKPNRTKPEYVVQGNYGHGWEDLTSSDNQAEARNDLRAYRENETGVPHRLITRRVPVTENLKESFKPANRGIQYVKCYNQYNYTIQELRVDNDNKTFERGQFTMGKPDKKTKNRQEFEDIVDNLKELGYTEIKSDYRSMRNKSRKGIPTNESIGVTTTSDDKRKALANYLDVDVEDVVQTYDENNFEVQSTGEEYIVADYDTAYDLAEQDVINTIDDLGIDAFTPYFQEWIMDYAVKEDWFKDALAESQRYYYEDMDEDEFIEVCKENNISPDDENAIDELVDIYLDGIDDYADEFRSAYGDSEFSTAVKENDLIDLDKVVEEAISVDGIAHFIAGYDGEEIELNDDLFAYRTN